jgi:hypothetical protein
VQGGSTEDCLNKEYPTLLVAALSAPIALLHATLHDIAASLSFRAAASAASALAATGRWDGRLGIAADTRHVDAGFRLQAWPGIMLAHSTDPSIGCASNGWAVDVGTQDRELAVKVDPDPLHLWQQTGVFEATGLPLPQAPALDGVTGDMEALLLVCDLTAW